MCVVMQMSLLKCQTHTHTRLTALFPGLPRWAGTRKVKPIWILLKQETLSGSGIGWAIFKSAPRSRQITMPAPHHSVFYRPDALPVAQPTAPKHWRHQKCQTISTYHSQVSYHISGVSGGQQEIADWELLLVVCSFISLPKLFVTKMSLNFLQPL